MPEELIKSSKQMSDFSLPRNPPQTRNRPSRAAEMDSMLQTRLIV